MEMKCGQCGECTLCRLLVKYPEKYELLFGVSSEQVKIDLNIDKRVFPQATKPRCKYEEGIHSYCPNDDERLHIRGCELYDQCIRGPAKSKMKVCASCSDYVRRDSYFPKEYTKPNHPTNYKWISTEKLAFDSIKLARMLPTNVSGVAGIPRSGMLPASIVALHLHVPLYELTELGKLNKLGHGSRGRNRDLKLRSNSGPLVIVDDTTYSGAAQKKIRQSMKGRDCIFCVVYHRPEAKTTPDYFVEKLPAPHLLEWNIFNASVFNGWAEETCYGHGIACDFDGILCENPPVPDADSGPGLEKYRQWLLNAKPNYLPFTLPIRLIVTGRLERFRSETNEWLKKHGIKYERMVMHSADKMSERDARCDIDSIKGYEYAKSGCGFFIESEYESAKRIHEVSDKPVIHPYTSTIFQ